MTERPALAVFADYSGAPPVDPLRSIRRDHPPQRPASEQVNMQMWHFLPAMVAHNRSRHQTAFTVSIEAREGVSTGISAFDRARTIAVAIDPVCGREDLASPGHVFPLVAQDGGVLVRAGHTEASVDLARLAGLNPSAVICEIMHDDGSMARGGDLQAFARTHDLPMLTIADLIAWRRQRERLVRCLSTETVDHSLLGPATLYVYENTLTQRQHLVLVKGTLHGDEVPLVRVHTLQLAPDLLGISDSLHRAAARLPIQRPSRRAFFMVAAE